MLSLVYERPLAASLTTAIDRLFRNEYRDLAKAVAMSEALGEQPGICRDEACQPRLAGCIPLCDGSDLDEHLGAKDRVHNTSVLLVTLLQYGCEGIVDRSAVFCGNSLVKPHSSY